MDREVWQCSERYKVKGVMGCANRHVEEETFAKGLSNGMECTSGEPSRFHVTVDGAVAE